MKHGLRGNFRVGQGAPRGGRFAYDRPPPLRRPPPRLLRPDVSRLPPPVRSHPLKRPVDIRDRRPVMSIPDRVRRLPPPERSYDRRPPGVQMLCAIYSLSLSSFAVQTTVGHFLILHLFTAPVYPKRSPRREYGRRDELPPPRSRATFGDYSSRVPVDRRPYRDEYSPRVSAYSDLGPRSAPRLSDRRAYIDDGYGGKIDRSLPTYREGRGRDYDTMSGSKRSYAEMVRAVNYCSLVFHAFSSYSSAN